MTKLTIELLEKFVNDIKTDGMCDITDSQVESALIRLLAYERAAKNPVEYKVVSRFGDISLFNHECEAEMYRNMKGFSVTPLYAAPVLPKQPESESIICWSCKKTITLTQHAEADGFCPLCDAEIELEPTQPVIPEQIEPAAWRCDKEGTKGVVITVHKQVADSWILKGWKVTPLIEANQSQPVSEPYKLEIDLDDADHFSITHLQEIIYGKELIWPEAKLLARFMLDVKQRVSAAPAQESE